MIEEVASCEFLMLNFLCGCGFFNFHFYSCAKGRGGTPFIQILGKEFFSGVGQETWWETSSNIVDRVADLLIEVISNNSFGQPPLLLPPSDRDSVAFGILL